MVPITGRMKPSPFVMLALIALSGCGGPALGPSLGPPETFTWDDQPIAFAPPPPEWRREAYLEGGMRGVRFVKERSGGEAISVADYYVLSDRNRRAALTELQDKLDTYDDRELLHQLSLARWRTDEPMGRSEAEVANAVNASIDRAVTAAIQADRFVVRNEIASALAATSRLSVQLEDVLESVIFKAERHSEPERFHVVSQRHVVIAEHPAERVDYTYQAPERVYYGCETYVVHDSHLFVADYIGTESGAKLFDRVVASIAFPLAGKK